MGTSQTDQYTLEKNAKNSWVYTGSIENGMDLMRIENDFKLFEKKKKESSNKRHRFYNTS
jgi:hypothetical protein